MQRGTCAMICALDSAPHSWRQATPSDAVAVARENLPSRRTRAAVHARRPPVRRSHRNDF